MKVKVLQYIKTAYELLVVDTKKKRKTVGDHADLCFYYGSTELACLEIGLADGGPHGTKELNEAGIKTPIMMKNFAIQISQQYGIKMSEIRIVGMVISGKKD